jgi:two-component system chemotaxis response regulator CheY
MQGLDGYEFIRRVRATADHSDIPVVIISSEGETKDRKKGYEAGANLYIAKPSEPQVLLDYIQMMIGGQS